MSMKRMFKKQMFTRQKFTCQKSTRRSHLLRSKLKLIYTSPLTYLMMCLQVSFLVIYICVNKVAAMSEYCRLLGKDLFLWMIAIPSLVVQHKAGVYSTCYSCMARIGGKRRMMAADYITLAVSTGISTCLELSVPLLFLQTNGTAPMEEGMLSLFSFFLMRYLLMGLFVQYLLYSIRYAFPNLQKRGGSICALPFLLYFLFTSPMEFLRIKGQYLQILDFSAGGNRVAAGAGAGLRGPVFFSNIHLAAYLALCIWIAMGCLWKRWEFWENEGVCAF